MAEARRIQRDGGSWVVGTEDGDLEARTVIVATGSRPRELGVPGEDRLHGRGISHCASCDGPLLTGKPAVVVGAGDSGLQEALTLATFASEILVVHRSERPTARRPTNAAPTRTRKSHCRGALSSRRSWGTKWSPPCAYAGL